MSRRSEETEYKVKANPRKTKDGTKYTPVFVDSTGKWRGIGKGYFDSKKAAEIAAHDAAKEHYSSGVAVVDSRKTVDQFWETVYKAHLGSLSASARDRYPSYYKNWIKPHFGHMLVVDVQVHHVQAWVNTVNNAPSIKSWYTKDSYYNLLSGIFTYAVKNKIRTTNPCADKEVRASLGKKPKRNPKVLNHEEFQAFLSKVPEYWRPLILCCLGIGGRPSEVIGLRPCDIDWDTGIVKIDHGVVIVNKERHGTSRLVSVPKDDEPRDVPLSWDTLALLEKVRATRGLSETSDQYLFIGPRGGHVDRGQVNKVVIRPALEAAGLAHKGMRMHGLRATFCSWMFDAGLDLITVMDLMGHSLASTTMVYSKTLDNTPEKVRGVWDRIDGKAHLSIVPEAEAS